MFIVRALPHQNLPRGKRAIESCLCDMFECSRIDCFRPMTICMSFWTAQSLELVP